jgi:hypothetical protein
MWPQWWIVKKTFGVICFYGWNWFCDFFGICFCLKLFVGYCGSFCDCGFKKIIL